jgi:uncharacterized protein YegL
MPGLEESVEFAENPEPRCPCVLLLDTSGSMQGAPLAALNEGLRTFKSDIAQDPLASRRVEVAVVTFNNDVRVAEDFTTANMFEAPVLNAGGQTFMGTGINKALDLLQARKAQYRANGISYFRPWVFMITDGEPQGESPEQIQRAAQRIRDDEAAKRVAFFAVGVEGANIATLSTVAVRAPMKLTGLDFREMFVWLSASMQKVSQSQLDEQVALPPPGWGTI